MRPTPRRHFLRQAAASVASIAALPALAARAPAARDPAPRALRVAHLTDPHVLDERGAPAGFAAALRHAQRQAIPPDLILFGGDLIMDALGAERPAVDVQWDVFQRVVAAELRTPARFCLGNHDVWGWALRDRPALEAEPLFGKRLALERLGLASPYYSFDQAGWHFVVLDSMQRDFASRFGYTARLDDAQFAWLAADLAATPPATPVCVLSHIPILGSAVFFDGELETNGTWIVPGAWMHIDARRLKDLFRRHPNVKTCLSGHVHLADDVTYLGVRYLCNGAVSGGWWKGPYQEFGPAYALVDFFADGSVENQLVYYQT